jgi:hypothetical protein
VARFPTDTRDLAGLKWAPDDRSIGVWDTNLEYAFLAYSPDGRRLGRFQVGFMYIHTHTNMHGRHTHVPCTHTQYTCVQIRTCRVHTQYTCACIQSVQHLPICPHIFESLDVYTYSRRMKGHSELHTHTICNVIFVYTYGSFQAYEGALGIVYVHTHYLYIA